MAETRQVAGLGPELDFLALSGLAGDAGNIRDRASRWMKSGDLIGIVPGIYVTAPELRKRPVSLEILANKIFGPSYVSFEYVLSRAGLIPEGVRAVTSATPKRNRDFDTPLGRFSYRPRGEALRGPPPRSRPLPRPRPQAARPVRPADAGSDFPPAPAQAPREETCMTPYSRTASRPR